MLYENLPTQGRMFGMTFEPAPALDRKLEDGQSVAFGDCKLEVLHTPGHSPGSVCFRFTGLLSLNFGVRARIKNTSKGFSKDKNYLILSNHLSYLDIFILFSEFPASFIASVDEVREMFLLGRITALSGGYFVERRNRSTLRTDIDEIADILRCGVNVALFPEGTTSTGEGVLPFKTPLINAAEKAGVEVLPVCIKYKKINGEDIGPENRDLVYFHGDMEFFSHVGKLLNVKRIDVEVTILEPLSVSSAGSRKDLSDNVYSVISSEYAGGVIEQDKKAAARE